MQFKCLNYNWSGITEGWVRIYLFSSIFFSSFGFISSLIWLFKGTSIFLSGIILNSISGNFKGSFKTLEVSFTVTSSVGVTNFIAFFSSFRVRILF